MATVLEDIDSLAQWISDALMSSGYKADFSPPSLWEIDRFFEEHSRNGTATARGLLADGFGQKIFAIGAYIGEVLRRDKGGAWKSDEDDPEAEINVALHLSDGAIVWPVQRAMKRFQLGEEESVAAYGYAIGVSVGSRPSKKRPWWKLR